MRRNRCELSMRLFNAESTSAGLSEAVAGLALGMFVLDSLGRIVHANSAARLHIGNGFVVTGERLSAAFAPDQNALKSALLSMLRGSPADLIDDPGPILIRRPHSGSPPVTYVLPLRNSQGDGIAQFLVSAKAIVLVVDPEPSEPPDPAIVRDILGLTLSEARLAALVGTGISLPEAAQRLEISKNTAKSALKRIFAKVGVSRQSELSALLTRLVLR